MLLRPIVLALGTGFTSSEGRALYDELKGTAEFHWYHDPLKGETWSSTFKIFVEKYGRPRVLLLFGGSVGHVDESFLSPLLPGLKLVASSGAGYDNIDVDYCSQNGIYVSNTPTSVTEATANCAVWLILSCLRNFIAFAESAKIGEWKGDLPASRDPDGLTLGIVGLGRIGANVAKKMAAFNMKILYTARHRASREIEEAAGGAKFVMTLEDLVSKSDVVSVHVPLSDATHHLIGEDVFSKFKSGGIFVNTARGKIHDERALIRGLQEGRLSMAGLDVFESEPTISDEFTKYGSLADRVVTTPHIGAYTVQTRTKLELELLENVREFLKNDVPKNPVNDPSN